MEEIKVFAFMMECPMFKKYDGRLKEMGLDGIFKYFNSL